MYTKEDLRKLNLVELDQLSKMILEVIQEKRLDPEEVNKVWKEQTKTDTGFKEDPWKN